MDESLTFYILHLSRDGGSIIWLMALERKNEAAISI